MKRIAAVFVLLLTVQGCGFTLWTRDKHAYLVHIVSEPKYEPRTSVTKEVLAPVRDLTGLPRHAMGATVLSDAVQAAGNARVKIGKAILPVDRDHSYLIVVNDQGFQIQALPIGELERRLSAMVPLEATPKEE